MPRAQRDGAPWAQAVAEAVAELVLVVSTSRGASTEVAERFGWHPCGVSFNELLVHAHLPRGYDRYVPHSGGHPTLKDFLGVERLRHDQWLSDALAVRASFCSSRPREVLDACGDVCVL